MDFFDDPGTSLKREYEIFRYLLEEFRLKYRLQETYPRRHDPDMVVLYQPEDGCWCAVGRLVSGEEVGLDEHLLYYVIEIPFDPELIEYMKKSGYCSASREMDPDKWLMLIINEKIRIDTYRRLMEAGYEWLCGNTGKESSLQPQAEYTDVSIPIRRELRAENVPEKIAEMRRMYQPNRKIPNDEAFCFYRQAVFMKDYRDQYEFHGTFMNIHPVYRMMTDAQLRGYFSWRTDLMENGQLDEKTPVSFLKLYVYELLHLIHSNAADTFEQLCAIEELYSGNDQLFGLELHRWINDFVVYYDLDKTAVSRRFRLRDMRHMQILDDVSRNPEEHDDEELKAAILALSENEIRRSAFMRDHTEDVLAVLAKAYRMYAREYRYKDMSFFEEAVCFYRSENYRMFSSAVFYEAEVPKDRTVWINEASIFSCKDGQWQRRCSYVLSEWNRLIGETDRLMRLAYRFGRPLKEKLGLRADREVLRQAIVEYKQEQAEAARPVVNINMNVLTSIRSDAALTRDSLLVEEETEAETEERTDSVPVYEQWEEENDDTLFTKEERILLKALLKGSDPAGIETLQNVSLSLLCDEINEKLIDEIGDTVIEFDGDVPVLIEDYIEDIRNILGEVNS